MDKLWSYQQPNKEHPNILALYLYKNSLIFILNHSQNTGFLLLSYYGSMQSKLSTV